MKKVIIDTNILLRLIIDEPSQLQLEARKIVDRIEKGKAIAIINELVIAECIWVLSSIYKRQKQEIVSIVGDTVLRDNFEVRDKDIIAEAFDIFVNNNISWVDSYLYCQSKKLGLNLVTFDENLIKLCK